MNKYMLYSYFTEIWRTTVREVLKPPAVMEVQLRASLKPPEHRYNVVPLGLRGALSWFCSY